MQLCPGKLSVIDLFSKLYALAIQYRVVDTGSDVYRNRGWGVKESGSSNSSLKTSAGS
jgi:hypothetical protein